ncbi:MAG: hypothetical protein ABSF23_13335 [Terracidiphilus sp.]|jgi:hypothetical protein
MRRTGCSLFFSRLIAAAASPDGLDSYYLTEDEFQQCRKIVEEAPL